MNFLGISGSLRAASTNSALLAAMAASAPDGLTLSVYDGLGQLPIFNPDNEAERAPPEVADLVERVTAADGLVIACPEYAHGVPGGMKNALDWLVSTPAAVGKPAMLVHASPRSLFARGALAEVLRTMSFDLCPDAPLELSLIGKKPEEWAATLAEPATISAMRRSLSDFAHFTVAH